MWSNAFSEFYVLGPGLNLGQVTTKKFCSFNRLREGSVAKKDQIKHSWRYKDGRTELEMNTELGNRGALTVDEFCEWLGVGRSLFYREVAAGRIRLRKIGRKSVVTVPDALTYRDSLPDAGLADVA